MSETDMAILSRCDLFVGLTEADIRAVAGCGEQIAFGPGEVVFEESSVASDLYVLLEGRVCVEIDAPGAPGGQQEHLQLALLRAGEVFGEIAFLEGKRRSARVCAIDGVRVLKLDGARLSALFQSNPACGYQAMRNLATVLAQRVVDVNFKWRQDRAGIGSPADPGADAGECA